MYDYMKALQRQFETIPQSIRDLNDEVNRTHKGPSSRLAKEDRKLLLRLVDLEDNLQSVATLHSFTCGYRLACSIHRELAAESMYSSPRRKKNEPAAERRLKTKTTQPTKNNPHPGGEHSNSKAQTVW